MHTRTNPDPRPKADHNLWSGSNTSARQNLELSGAVSSCSSGEGLHVCHGHHVGKVLHSPSLAGQTLLHGERVWSNSPHHLVSNTPIISWRVNFDLVASGALGCLFGMLLGEGGVLTEASLFRTRPNHVYTYFIKYTAAEYATPKPDGNLTRLSPRVRESGP